MASRKVDILLSTRAEITVVAPDAVDEIRKSAAQGVLNWEKRLYRKGEASDYFLTIAATNVREVNEQVARDARAALRLVNVVDMPDLCNFLVPSIVKRGELQIAISTSGAFPALAKMLRNEMEDMYPMSWARLLKKLREFRNELNKAVDNQDVRKEILERVADSTEVMEFLNGNEAVLEAYLSDALDSCRTQS